MHFVRICQFLDYFEERKDHQHTSQCTMRDGACIVYIGVVCILTILVVECVRGLWVGHKRWDSVTVGSRVREID